MTSRHADPKAAPSVCDPVAPVVDDLLTVYDSLPTGLELVRRQ
jgi:hypothetical protein